MLKKIGKGKYEKYIGASVRFHISPYFSSFFKVK